MKKYLILENIRSAYNVGAILRTADGAGFDKIFLVGYTPTPLDRFGRVQAEIHKTSLGASETVSWEQYESVTDLIIKLQSDGVQVVAVEQVAGAKSLSDFAPANQVAYILGNEIDGVSNVALETVDEIVEIPMLGQKESLNVSVAAGVVMYHGL